MGLKGGLGNERTEGTVMTSVTLRFYWLLTSERYAAAAASLQSYSTLCDPIDGSPPGSAVPGILQARTPEWAAIDLYAEYIKKLLNWVKHTMESRLPGEILITSDMPMMPL